jgi:hypothetical protein
MGIFHEQVEIVNRTSKPLTVRYDGQDITIPPGYTPGVDGKPGVRIKDQHIMVPRLIIPYALNQNVLMGSEDPQSPSHFDSLVGFIEPKEKKTRWYHDVTYVEQTEELTRVPLREYLEDDPQVTDIKVRGRKIDAGVSMPRGGVFDVRER